MVRLQVSRTEVQHQGGDAHRALGLGEEGRVGEHGGLRIQDEGDDTAPCLEFQLLVVQHALTFGDRITQRSHPAFRAFQIGQGGPDLAADAELQLLARESCFF